MNYSSPLLHGNVSSLFEKHLSKLPRTIIKKLLPGYIVAPGSCYFPEAIEVEGHFQKFILRAGHKTPASLAFSRVVFVGYKDGEDTLSDVSEMAVCSQSSFYKHLTNPQLGVSGKVYSNNIHTLSESDAWWQAEFPETVSVRLIFLYRTVGWNIINQQHVRVCAQSKDGQEKILFYPEKSASHLHNMSLNVIKAIQGAYWLAENSTDDVCREMDELSECIDKFLAGLGFSAITKQSSLDKLLSPIKRLFSYQQSAPQDWAFENSVEFADALMNLALKALPARSSFGLTADEALSITCRGSKARYIRLVVYGDLPAGFRGALLEDESGKSVHSLDQGELKFSYRMSAFSSPNSYRLGLTSPVSCRYVDMGEVKTFDKLKLWNLNVQHAGNSSFTEISVRNEKDEPWKILYDNGASYRHACAILKLADYLLRSQWTPSYGKLIGQLFTTYRRKALMAPIARLVRQKEVLNAAVFEGANVASSKMRYAAPLMLGKHGLRVPVKFRDQKVVVGHMLEMRDKIRALGYTPMLMYGTLLGAIREKDFIAHDDDLDIAIIMDGLGPDDLLEATDKFVVELNENGVKALRAGAAHAPLIHCHRGPVTIDIFLLGHVNDTVYWPHTALKMVPERADIFLPSKTLEFKGELFDCPNNPEAVSEARYGSTWRTPVQSFEW